ncbi:MAG: hypothetical protein P8164_15610 [Gammaproteobacteria bacterium]|jgi:hypothetical protein
MYRALLELIIAVVLIQNGTALAGEENTRYVSVSAAVLSPNGYNFDHIRDFDTGFGLAATVGWVAENLVFEAQYLDTNTPMESSRANAIDMNWAPGGIGPTKYYVQAMTINIGYISPLDQSTFLKGTVGFSRCKSHIVRPDKQASRTAFELSFGGALVWHVYKKAFATVGFTILNELVGTGNFGLMVFY